MSDKEKEMDEIDEALLPVQLDSKDEQIVQAIVDAETKDELQAQFDLFNMNQSKKNALRMIKLEGLLTRVEDQAIERFEKRPDQVSNRELLDYMQIVSAQIDRSQHVVDSLQDKQMIKPIDRSTTNVQINVGTDLDRDSKEKVTSAIKGILAMLRDSKTPNTDNNIVINQSPITEEKPEPVKVIEPVILEEDNE